MTVFARRKAIGYLRSDISGAQQVWDELQMRSAAKAHGCTLAKTYVFGAHTDHPDQRLVNAVKSTSAEVVFVPGIAHFDSASAIPPALAPLVDVITVSPDYVYVKHAPVEEPA